MIFDVVLLLILARGCLCQEITLSPPILISPCINESRAEKDFFAFNGTFGKDVPSLVAEGWNNIMYIYVFPVISNKMIYCVLNYVNDECTVNARQGCSCVYQFKQIHFKINYTLQSRYSRGHFYIKWSQTGLRTISSLKNYTLPPIYDVKTAHLTLTIGGEMGSLAKTRSCSFSLTFGTSNLMQLCCSDMAMPCYTQISFLGTVVATNESPCVVYSPTSDGVTGTLELSYSVCTQTDYMIGSNCTIQTGVVTTRMTTPTTSVITAETGDGAVTTAIGDGAGATGTGDGVITTATGNGVVTTATGDGVGIQATGKTSDPSQPRTSNTFRIAFWGALVLILLVINVALVSLYTIRGKGSEEAAAPEPQRDSQQDNQEEEEEAAPPVQLEEVETYVASPVSLI
ncbi:hypothetical protein BsWGS_10902 [Bradybaena similaris]